jgi:hypothetical protein
MTEIGESKIKKDKEDTERKNRKIREMGLRKFGMRN